MRALCDSYNTAAQHRLVLGSVAYTGVMCGRLNVTADPLTQLLMEVFGIEPLARLGEWPSDINIAPTQAVAAVRSLGQVSASDSDSDAQAADYRLDRLRWWLTPSWSKEMSTKYAMFNAKAETLASKPAFAKSFRSRRCVIPVSGFYEWSRVALTQTDLAGATTQSAKTPYFIRPADTAGLLLAGVWDRWQDPQGDALVESFAIVTTAASAGLQQLHHRQPVILDAAGAQLWLDGATAPEDLQPLLEPQLRIDLQLVPVGRELNNARYKDPSGINPVGPIIEVDSDHVTH